MKVTSLNLSRTISHELERTSSDLFDLQQKIASAKRIIKPSDDPVGAVSATHLRSSSSEYNQYKNNVIYSQSFLQSTQTALDQALELINRAQELSISQGSSSGSNATRASAAIEIQSLMDQMVLLGNSRVAGKYVFAGHDTTSAPFQSDGTYIADSGELKVSISPNSDIKINLSGNEVFTSGNGGADLFGILNTLKTALESNNIQGITDNIDDLISAYDIVSARLSETGSKISRLDRTTLSIESSIVDMKLMLSDVEDLDIAEAIIELNSRQNILEAAMASAGRILKLNLVNYL